MSKSNVLINEKQEITYSKVLSSPINKITKITKLPVTYRKALLVPTGEYKQYDGSLTTNNTMEELESDILENDHTMKNSKIKEGYESYHEITSPLNKKIKISNLIDEHTKQEKKTAYINFIEQNQSFENYLANMKNEIEKLKRDTAELKESEKNRKKLDAEIAVFRKETQYPLYIQQLLQETIKRMLGMKNNTLSTETERKAFFDALTKYIVPKTTKPTELTPDLQKKIITMYYDQKDVRNNIAHPDKFTNKNVLKDSILDVKTKDKQDLYLEMAKHIGIEFTNPSK